MKLFIRQLTPAYEPFLWEMLYHALYVPESCEPFPREILTELETAKYVLGWGRANDLAFAAVEETTQQPLGAVWIRLFTSENPGYGYVDDDTPELSVAVLPAHRNKGVGTELLNHMIAEAAKQYSGLSLSVSFDNPAKRLYQRLGFEIVERHVTSITMLKRLAMEDGVLNAPGKDRRSPQGDRS